MHKFLLILFVLITFEASIVYSSEKVSGYFDCKIKGIRIISINEGKHEEFSGYKDSLKKGDNLTISYRNTTNEHFYLKAEGLGNNLISFIHSQTPTTKNPTGNSYSKLHFNKKELNCEKNDFTCIREDMMLIDSFYMNKLVFNEDYIYARYLDRSITLARYYKNDWNGIFSDFANYDELSTYNFTLDCRHRDDQLKDIIDKLKNLINKLNG